MSDPVKPDDLPFFSRWSMHKTAAVSGAAERVADAPGAPIEKINTSTGAPLEAKMPETPRPEPIAPAEVDAESRPPAKPELPSIDSLTHESDFTGFMAKEVDPGLRNQAMKKLFTNPHYQFEQMDKLDIYIDDYSKPDPIPPEMLRSMYQSKSLFLFDDDEKEKDKKKEKDDAKPALTAAQSAESLAAQDTPAIEQTVQVGNDDERSRIPSEPENVASPVKETPKQSSTGALNEDIAVPAHTARPKTPQTLSAIAIKSDP